MVLSILFMTFPGNNLIGGGLERDIGSAWRLLLSMDRLSNGQDIGGLGRRWLGLGFLGKSSRCNDLCCWHLKQRVKIYMCVRRNNLHFQLQKLRNVTEKEVRIEN
jgi:hypothetical protein